MNRGHNIGKKLTLTTKQF